MEAAWWGQHNAGRLERTHRAPLLCGRVLGGGGRVHVCVCESAHVWGCHTRVVELARCHRWLGTAAPVD